MIIDVPITLVVLLCTLVLLAMRFYHARQLRSIATLLRARSREFDAAAKQNGAASNKAFLLGKADAYSYAYLVVTSKLLGLRNPSDVPMILTIDETDNTIARTPFVNEERNQ